MHRRVEPKTGAKFGAQKSGVNRGAKSGTQKGGAKKGIPILNTEALELKGERNMVPRRAE